MKVSYNLQRVLNYCPSTGYLAKIVVRYINTSHFKTSLAIKCEKKKNFTMS